MPAGGVFPTDLKVLERAMPIPYDLTFELAIYASNMDQMFQILEQILIVFDPVLQLQINDSPFDWARQCSVELLSLASEENYPTGPEKRIIVWNLNFRMSTWISPPGALKDDLVRTIIQRFGDIEGFSLDTYGESGDLEPFAGDIWATTTIDESQVTVNSP